eukprot:766055-Hanusia_phi.AAC.6
MCKGSSSYLFELLLAFDPDALKNPLLLVRCRRSRDVSLSPQGHAMLGRQEQAIQLSFRLVRNSESFDLSSRASNPWRSDSAWHSNSLITPIHVDTPVFLLSPTSTSLSSSTRNAASGSR